MNGRKVDDFVRPARAVEVPIPPGPKEPAELGFEIVAGQPQLMLDLVQADGEREAHGYHNLNAVKLEKGAKLTLTFTDCTIMVTGRNLLPLYNHIAAHTAWRLTASSTCFDEKKTVTWLEKIEITKVGG